MYDDYQKGQSWSIQGTMSDDITTAKAFLTDIEKRFVKNEKTEIGTILTSLISLRYNR